MIKTAIYIERKKKMNKELEEYIQNNIFPRYQKYYSHGMIHINNVIKNILELADYFI